MRGLGKWLVRAGLVVWSFGAVAAVSGVWVTMPPIVVEWLVLSLAGTSGGLLVAAGVAVGRTNGATSLEPSLVQPSAEPAGKFGEHVEGLALPAPAAFRSPVAQRNGEHDPAT